MDRREYSDCEKKLLDITDGSTCTGKERPVHFCRVMKENQGYIGKLNPYGTDGDGMEKRNPLIVALGDSVTAGHFEFCHDMDKVFHLLEKGVEAGDGPLEVVDASECYPERFRSLLIRAYRQTSVSVVNSGIAGDTLLGMQKRLYRDAIRYQPDLLIINGSLNWQPECGTVSFYKNVLREMIRAVKNETGTDIVLLTPNMALKEPWGEKDTTLEERVAVIRELAEEEKVCLVDYYHLWELYEQAGYPVAELLANGWNHPTAAGHEAYARALMKLICEKSADMPKS